MNKCHIILQIHTLTHHCAATLLDDKIDQFNLLRVWSRLNWEVHCWKCWVMTLNGPSPDSNILLRIAMHSYRIARPRWHNNDSVAHKLTPHWRLYLTIVMEGCTRCKVSVFSYILLTASLLPLPSFQLPTPSAPYVSLHPFKRQSISGLQNTNAYFPCAYSGCVLGCSTPGVTIHPLHKSPPSGHPTLSTIERMSSSSRNSNQCYS